LDDLSGAAPKLRKSAQIVDRRVAALLMTPILLTVWGKLFAPAGMQAGMIQQSNLLSATRGSASAG